MALWLSLAMDSPELNEAQPMISVSSTATPSTASAENYDHPFFEEEFKKSVDAPYITEAMVHWDDSARELDDLVKQAFEMGRRFERGEIKPPEVEVE